LSRSAVVADVAALADALIAARAERQFSPVRITTPIDASSRRVERESSRHRLRPERAAHLGPAMMIRAIPAAVSAITSP
jgi:hypothetical protein